MRLNELLNNFLDGQMVYIYNVLGERVASGPVMLVKENFSRLEAEVESYTHYFDTNRHHIILK